MSSKQITMALLPKFSGFISMTFSSLILYSVLGVKILQQQRKQQQTQVYDRLIMGMSIADLFGSFWMFMSTWPIPESTGALWAVGNQATCDLQGFFTQGTTIASAIYNASLTVYFLLVVVKQWKKPTLERYEWCFHVVPWIWGIGTGIAGVPLALYNNANLWCFIAEAPNDPERGQNANFYRMVFFYGPLYLMITIVTVNVLLIVWYVRKVTTRALMNDASATARKGGRRTNTEEDDDDDEDDFDGEGFLSSSLSAMGKSNNANNDGKTVTNRSSSEMISVPLPTPSTTTSVATSTAGQESNSASRNRYVKWRQKVARQNLRYAFAFYWTWLPISSVRMLQIVGHKVPFWLIVIACITTPMQGLPQCFVYFYPKYVNYQKHNRDTRPRLWDWIRAGLPTATSGRRRRHRHRHRRGGAGCDEEMGGGDGLTKTNDPTKTKPVVPYTTTSKNGLLPASRVTVDSWNALDPMSSVTCSGALLESDVVDNENYYYNNNNNPSNKPKSGCSLITISEETSERQQLEEVEVTTSGSGGVDTVDQHQQQQHQQQQQRQQTMMFQQEQSGGEGTTTKTTATAITATTAARTNQEQRENITRLDVGEDHPDDVVNVEGDDFEDEVARWYG